MKHPYRGGFALVLAAAMLAPVGTSATAATFTPPVAADSASNSNLVHVVVMLNDQPSDPSTSTEKALVATQDSLLDSWKQTYGLTVDRQFGYLLNGFSATMPAAKMLALAQEPQVASVKIERVYQQAVTDFDDSPTLQPSEHAAREVQGVPTAWNTYGTDGTGTVIAIIDSGIDTSHQDMRLDTEAQAKVKIKNINPASDAHFTLKVPNGYNYADENYTVKDTTASQHGMHVSGIVAANGSLDGQTAEQAWENGRVDGVAPNAQLLAMKVFSNLSDSGAQDSDIIAAIEDSVKLGADVLNLSLGSTNGLNNTSDGTYRALAKAREEGVVVDIAAGNEGQNYSETGINDDSLGLLDDGTLGSPGSNQDAFTVASINNTEITSPQAYYSTGGEESSTLYALQTGEADGKPHTLVDVGLGQTSDYTEGQDLAGAWALIERGGITFTEKFKNAIDHGAGGVVIFNSEEGGEELLSMAGVDDITIPGGSIPRSVGLALRQSLKAGGKATIRFTEEVAASDNPKALQPSDFTSWGPTPSLDFKPEIAAIGGSVYSTLNDNTYGTMSGTSMATPNVSGMASLLVEGFAQRYPDLSAAARGELVRQALMNTALIPTTADGVPYAPRQVGAGLAQVDKALATNVFATVDGSAAVALREINGAKSFTVTLTNYSDAPVSYTVPAQKVIGESNKAGEVTTTSVSSETLSSSASTVTVPAKDNATVTFTLTPDTSSSHFIEGWAQLTSQTEGAPDLAVPYLGFVGDWDAETIVAAPGTTISGDPTKSITELVTSWGGFTMPLSSEETGTFAISPNGDGDMDVVAPHLMLLRNASDAEYSVLDASGNLVKVIGQEQELRRTTTKDWASATGSVAYEASSYAFDGTVWDAQKADFVPVPDGKYTFRVRTRLSDAGDWQTVDMPFTVDATAPVLNFGELSGTSLPLTVTETGSGLPQNPTVTAPDGTELTVTKTADNTYTVEVPAGTAYVTAAVVDAGFNLATATKILANDVHLVVPDEAALAKTAVGTTSPLVHDGKLTVQGFVTADVDHVSVAGTQTPVENGRFTAEVPLTEGKQSIELIAYAADGSVVDQLTLSVTYDDTAPTLEITNLNADGTLPVADDGTVTVTGKVTDERAGAELSVDVYGTPAEVAADGTFSATTTVDADVVSIPVLASDGANNTTQDVPLAGRTQEEPQWNKPTFDGDCRADLSACFASSNDSGATDHSYTLTGKAGDAATLRFTPATTFDAQGNAVNSQPITATVAADGSFSVELPAQLGIDHFRFEALDKDGKTLLDQSFALYLDVTMPTLDFTTPTLYAGTLFANSNEVAFTGSAQDDGWGYTLAINDSTVLGVFNSSGMGAESNERKFDQKVTVADGDTLLIFANDSMGNKLEGQIPVVIDKDAPTTGIDTINDGETVADQRVLTASATDAYLATARVSLDGKVVKDLATATAAQAGTVQGALVPVHDDPNSSDATAEAEAAPEGDTTADTEAAPEGDTTADTEAAPEGDATNSADDNEETAAEPQTLSAQVATADLAAGVHTVTVTARDLAGNESTTTRSFVIDDAATIQGDDSVNLTVNRADLAEQDLLASQVLSHYSVADDGAVLADGTVSDPDTTKLALAPGTILREGEQSVVLIATDAAGHTASRTVNVTIALEQITLTDGQVSATSTFNRNDAITAKLTDGKLELSNKPEFAALDAVITVPAAQGTTVQWVMADGTKVPVAATWKDGVLTFTGSSRATYLLNAASTGSTPGDATNAGATGSGNSADTGSAADAGSATAGKRVIGTSTGSLSKTGTDAPFLVVLSAAVLGAGLVLARRTRQHH